MNNIQKIIQELKIEVDVELRYQMTIAIKEVLEKSNEGEIGWGDFIGEIRNILDLGEELAKNNWGKK